MWLDARGGQNENKRVRGFILTHCFTQKPEFAARAFVFLTICNRGVELGLGCPLGHEPPCGSSFFAAILAVAIQAATSCASAK